MTLSEFIEKIENIVEKNIKLKEDKFTVEDKILKIEKILNKGELKDRIKIEAKTFALSDNFYFTVDDVPIVKLIAKLDYVGKIDTYEINQIDIIEELYNDKSAIPNLRLNTVIYDIKERNRNREIERLKDDIKTREDEINYLKSKIMSLDDEREEDLSKYIYTIDPDFDPLYDENNLPFPLDEPEVER